MRVLLHAGMPKTGSTALQARLRESRNTLRRQAGTVYPKGRANPNYLAGAAYDIHDMPRFFRQAYGNDNSAFKADFAAFWAAIRALVERHRPETLLLSSEELFSPLPRDGARNLRSLLRSLADRIDVVVYVRRPSELYLASAQQALKASQYVIAAEPIPYRASLEALAAVADRLSVMEYDRSEFPSGDIALDFARRFLPDAEGILARTRVPSVNETVSAEIMAALQGYRAAAHRDAHDVFTKDTGIFLRGLRDREVALGDGRRPQLHLDVREYIDHASPDLIWLRDTYGIAFADIDYGNIAEREPLRPERVSDICAVDEARKDLLIYGLIEDALRSHAREPVNLHTFQTLRDRPGENRRSPSGRFRRWVGIQRKA